MSEDYIKGVKHLKNTAIGAIFFLVMQSKFSEVFVCSIMGSSHVRHHFHFLCWKRKLDKLTWVIIESPKHHVSLLYTGTIIWEASFFAWRCMEQKRKRLFLFGFVLTEQQGHNQDPIRRYQSIARHFDGGIIIVRLMGP